jgi:hypothetical protein
VVPVDEGKIDRHMGLARTPAFVEMVDHVWNLVRGEAILAERSGAA